MKFKNLFITLGLALAVGVGASAFLGSKAEVKEAKAATYVNDEYVAPTLDYKKVFFTDNGFGNLHIHYDGPTSKTTWPGVAMIWNYNNEYSQGVFSYDVPADTETIVFNNNNGKQTVDITDLSKNAFYITGTTDGSGHYEVGSYSVDTNVIYYLDVKGALSPTHAYAWLNNEVHSGSPRDPQNSVHNVPGRDNLFYKEVWGGYTCFIFLSESQQTSDKNPTTMDGTCAVGDTAMFSDNSLISIEAAQFIDENMHLADYDSERHVGVDGDNYCKNDNPNHYYLTAKTAYNKLSSNAVKNEVTGISYVLARLQAWALANEEEFVLSAGVYGFSSSRSAITPISNKNDQEIIIVTISAISLIALGGFLLLKKRKEA